MSSDDHPASTAVLTRAKRAARWSVAGYVAQHLLRFGTNVLMTRLLLKEHFGIMALAQAFLTGLQLFSDVGIGPAIIQNKHGGEPDFLNTAWTIQVVRGMALSAIAAVAATPIAVFYDEPQLVTFIPVLGLSAALAGLRSSKSFALSRELALGRLVIIELASHVCSLAAMVAVAWNTRSIWALAAGALVQSGSYSLMSHIALPGVSNRLRWHGPSVNNLVAFGRWVFLSTALMFLSGQADRLVFGRLVTLGELGVYSIAVLLVTAPASALSNLNGNIVFPAYSQAYLAGSPLAPMYARVRWPMLVIGGWAISALMVGGPSLVRVLYDDRYWDAGWMVTVLGTGVWFGVVLEGTNGAALLAQGHTRWVAAGSLSKLVGMLALLPIGFHMDGFRGCLWALVVAEFCRYGISTFAVRRHGLRGVSQDMRASGMLAVAVAAGWLMNRGLEPMQLASLVHTLLSIVVTSALWFPLVRNHLPRRGRPSTAVASG